MVYEDFSYPWWLQGSRFLRSCSHLRFCKKKRLRTLKFLHLAAKSVSDEITSSHQEYTLGNPNREYFDDDLKNVFLGKFYHGTQSSYLMKKSISGGFGIEEGYPYLDKTVVQEYLNLLRIKK